MSRLEVTSEAENDIEGIWHFVSKDGISRADGVLAAIWRHLELLAESPLVGRSRDQLLPGLRSFPVAPFYRPIENGARIVRVVHGAKDIRREDFTDEP